MRRLFFILIAVVSLLSSCEQMRSTWHRHDRIAKVGGDILYESDIINLLPQGISPQDSAAIVEQYIRSWALSRLMLKKAKEELPKSEKDVSRQVEEFRNNLLDFRYEKYYLESRLDTVVTEAEKQAYYSEHINNYILPYPIVRGRIVSLLTKSPFCDMIRNSFTVEDPNEVASLEEFCYVSAEKYTDFDKKWVSISTMAGEIPGLSVENLEKELLYRRAFIHEEGGTSYFVYILDKVNANEVSPYEYNSDRISETIISKRKQELLNELERDLLNDALTTKTLKLYDTK